MSPEEEQDLEELRKLQSLQNPVVTAQDIVSSLLGVGKKRAPEHSKEGTYYRRHFAEELIPVLEAMQEDGNDRVYRYAKFLHLSRQSLFLKVSQAFLYLMDKMDPDKKWTSMRGEIIIRKEHIGVAMRWKKNIIDSLGEPDVVVPREEILTWKQKVDKFLSDAPDGSKLHEKNLALTDDEVNDLRISLHDLKGIVAVIKSNEIKILKLNAEEQNEL